MSTTALAQHGRASRYYALVAGASFCLGAGMELFMIKTGFYEKVTMIEAEERRERLLARRSGAGSDL